MYMGYTCCGTGRGLCVLGAFPASRVGCAFFDEKERPPRTISAKSFMSLSMAQRIVIGVPSAVSTWYGSMTAT